MATHDSTTKHCSKCKRELPATTEYFIKQSDSRDGFYSQCKECRHESGRNYYPSHPAIEYKQCSVCKETKPLSEFHKYRLSADGYKHICKLCRSKIEGFNYRPPIPDGYMQCSTCKRLLPATSEFFQVDSRKSGGLCSPCKDCGREYHKKWRLNHLDASRQSTRQWRSKNRKRAMQMSLDWAKRNPERSRLIRHKNRVIRRKLPYTLTLSEWEQAIKYFHGCCAVCGRQLNDLFGEHTAAMDHWIPVNSPNCPGTIADNIVPLCHGREGCNNHKSDRDPIEFLKTTFGKRKAEKILERIEAYFEWVRGMI